MAKQNNKPNPTSNPVTPPASAASVNPFGAPQAPYVSAAKANQLSTQPCIVCGKHLLNGQSLVRGVGPTCIPQVHAQLPAGVTLIGGNGTTVATNAQVAAAVLAAKAVVSPNYVASSNGIPQVQANATYGQAVGTPFVKVATVHINMAAAKVPISLMVRAFGGDKGFKAPYIGAKAPWAVVTVGRTRYLHPACNTPQAWAELRQASLQGLLPKL